jgi:Domain of unknown function (DUF4372)
MIPGICICTQEVDANFIWCRFESGLTNRRYFSRFFPLGSAAVNFGRTLFSQVMDFVPWTSFGRLVTKYGGDVRVRKFRCTEQFRTMAFAQLTFRESLRDIEACLDAQPSKLYGMGFRNPVAKSTLADANEQRDWRMWHDLAAILIRCARKLYADDDIGLDLDNTVYALDTQSICVFRCFRGPIFEARRQLLKCTRCSTSVARSPVLSIFPTAKWAMRWHWI